MNERIKSLAIQSGVVESHVDWENAGGDLLEKFAELVIKDCIMLCAEWIEIDKDLKKTKSWVGVDPEIGPEFCIDSIKNHFGIE